MKPALIPTDLESALEKLLAFAAEDPDRCDRALSEFLGEGDSLDEQQSQAFFAFLGQGHAMKDGERLVDRFLRVRGKKLSAPERNALRALSTAWFSLFEVMEVRPEEGQLVLRDTVLGGEVEVEEQAAAKELSRYDMLLAWIQPGARKTNLLGVGTLVPRVHREPVDVALRSALSSARKKSPKADERALLRRVSGKAHAALSDALRKFRPRLVTTEGNEVVFSSAHYRIPAGDKVEKILDKDRRVDGRKAGHYIWIEPGAGPENKLGTIRITGRNLVLETNSRERLERGKALVAEMLGKHAEHVADQLQDPWHALAEQAQSAPAPAPAKAKAEATRVAIEAKKKLAQWVDEKLEALDGATPREAVKTRKGKAVVVELMKDLENHWVRLAGGRPIDVAPVYKALGLERA